jgi:hypothetical protein
MGPPSIHELGLGGGVSSGTIDRGSVNPAGCNRQWTASVFVRSETAPFDSAIPGELPPMVLERVGFDTDRAAPTLRQGPSVSSCSRSRTCEVSMLGSRSYWISQFAIALVEVGNLGWGSPNAATWPRRCGSGRPRRSRPCDPHRAPSPSLPPEPSVLRRIVVRRAIQQRVPERSSGPTRPNLLVSEPRCAALPMRPRARRSSDGAEKPRGLAAWGVRQVQGPPQAAGAPPPTQSLRHGDALASSHEDEQGRGPSPSPAGLAGAAARRRMRWIQQPPILGPLAVGTKRDRLASGRASR